VTCAGGLPTSVRARRTTNADATTSTTTSPEDGRLSAHLSVGSGVHRPTMTSYPVRVRRRLRLCAVSSVRRRCRFIRLLVSAVCLSIVCIHSWIVRSCYRKLLLIRYTRSCNALLNVRAASQPTNVRLRRRVFIMYHSSVASRCSFYNLILCVHSTLLLVHSLHLHLCSTYAIQQTSAQSEE